MAYDNYSISAWMDEQPRIYIQEENPLVIGERVIIEITDDDATVSDDGFLDLKDFLDLLNKKKLTPTMSNRDKQKAWEMTDYHSQIRVTGRMIPIKTSHMLDSRMILEKDLEELIRIKAILHIARHNMPNSTHIRTIIPTHITSDTRKYLAWSNWIGKCAEDNFLLVTRFIHRTISQIINAVNDACGPRSWANLTRYLRQKVFGAVFDQYPAFTMSKFRAEESRFVDFTEIFCKARGRRDAEAKCKWREYYRYTYVCMCEKMFMELEYGIDGVREAWLCMNRRERVRDMDLGGAYDLPAVAFLAFEKF
ncbi:uncharacterized protein RSE6_05828 [Rhynchosporium secalis]|uniref:Uncharacterized protein n=1 Tax=Rhynchosporium secalis TaxID=38038 RepID=A0A1E1M8U3_RHYSE|nr:uncharacterized protein RSE6_05828 [Rhynchosporium secalis]